MFRSSCPPAAWAHSTSSTPTYNGCQEIDHLGGSRSFLLLVEQELVEIVSEGGGRERPRSFKAGTISVAPADSMCTGQSDDLLVVKAVGVELIQRRDILRTEERRRTPYG